MKKQTDNTLATAVLNSPHGTLLHGQEGTGKTTALLDIANAALARGREVVALDLIQPDARFTKMGKQLGVTHVISPDRAERILDGFLADLAAHNDGETQDFPLLLVDDFSKVERQFPAVQEQLRKLAVRGKTTLTPVIAQYRSGVGLGAPYAENFVQLVHPEGHGLVHDFRWVFPDRVNAGVMPLLEALTLAKKPGLAVIRAFGKPAQPVTF